MTMTFWICLVCYFFVSALVGAWARELVPRAKDENAVAFIGLCSAIGLPVFLYFVIRRLVFGERKPNREKLEAELAAIGKRRGDLIERAYNQAITADEILELTKLDKRSYEILTILYPASDRFEKQMEKIAERLGEKLEK